MGSEAAILAMVRNRLGRLRHCRVFRNNVGEAWLGQATRLRDGSVLIKNPKRVIYGLTPGSSDLIGFTSVIVSPDMVGRRVALFTALETKSAKGVATASQLNFLRVVREAGGIAGIAHNEEEAAALVSAPLIPGG